MTGFGNYLEEQEYPKWRHAVRRKHSYMFLVAFFDASAIAMLDERRCCLISTDLSIWPDATLASKRGISSVQSWFFTIVGFSTH
jgi:hypothetical protein